MPETIGLMESWFPFRSDAGAVKCSVESRD